MELNLNLGFLQALSASGQHGFLLVGEKSFIHVAHLCGRKLCLNTAEICWRTSFMPSSASLKPLPIFVFLSAFYGLTGYEVGAVT